MCQKSTETLYYDGQCPLCAREMEKLRRSINDQLELIDIHSLSSFEPGYDKATLLKTLHLRQADGRWAKGLDANIRAWQHAGLKWSIAWLKWPIIAPISRWIYAFWAKTRYQKLYGRCDNQRCKQV